ncbi:putative N-succinyldiaminopimelate aminotransferase DapC [Corynebacterium deserti GIMN1.010]|uniref:Putative N-succinyldiaminopimelate aminotransferase DapC n=1 Tax=Corynebacterium deserti GIMN1.010 TaxID=931089 RepID=A0A0M4CF01_9CORY|nr:pyridoxal phosphate-dependent aminotransferase [Corynebacterium deserti]ALC05265.1 putative N-succinyldiaminopimelate aminotransferase DapC [Corynebacterium deserti GIMN1.010]
MSNDFVVSRLQPFGETIFATMTQRAVEKGAINLGQGFPDEDGPRRMLEIASEQILGGNNQYSSGRGDLALRTAVANDHLERYKMEYDPLSEVLITVGATEAITASVLGLVEPGEEIIVLEPYYDAYAAAIALAGAVRVAVPLQELENTWEIDVDALHKAVTKKTKMIIVNSPHNPTGSVFSKKALKELAGIARAYDLLVLSDEVYEHLVFDGAKHVSVAKLPGMWDRTVTVSSAAKSFNVTGWKTGWALAPAPLLDAVLKAKQFMSYVGATPFQPAVAHAIEHEQAWVEEMRAGLETKRDILRTALSKAGLKLYDSDGTYFVVADIGDRDGAEFCFELIDKVGVAAIPVQAFVDHPKSWSSKVRFAFCKKEETLREAAKRLKGIKNL